MPKIIFHLELSNITTIENVQIINYLNIFKKCVKQNLICIIKLLKN